MTIEEAIRLLADIPPWPNENDDPCYLDAIRLGIEALKRLRHDRLVVKPKHILLMPGETEGGYK